VKGFAKGQYVKHSVYGCGVITECDQERTAIDFDLHGPKKFVTSMLAVDQAEGTPPERPIRKRVKRAASSATRPATGTK
jgi:hypothetical protein